MEREPKVPPDVIKNLAEGLIKAGWSTTVKEAKSEQIMKVILVEEEVVMVESTEGVKPLRFSQITELRFTNPNPKP